MSNTLKQSEPMRWWLATHKPLVWVIAPVLTTFIVIAGVAFYEWVAEHRYRSRIQQMRSQGIPVDTISLMARCREKSHPEGTVAWSEIFVAQRMLAQTNHEWLSFPADSRMHGELTSGGVWPDEQRTARFLGQLRPLFKKVEQALEYPAPVMQPIGFEGSFSDGFSSLCRHLQIEVEHALYHREVERATRALDLMGRIAEIEQSESRIGYPNSAYDSTKQTEYSTIGRSLSTNLWDEKYILELIDRLQEDREIKQQWRSSVVRQRANWIDYVNSLSKTSLSSWPDRFAQSVMIGSVKNRVLDFFEERETIADNGFERFESRAKSMDRKYFQASPQNHLITDSIYNLSSNDMYTGNWNNLENYRRMVCTALAIKLFEKTQNRWPKELEELSAVGFSKNDWMTVRADRFGYEIDGESAVVWLWSNPVTGPGRRDIAPNLKAIQVPIEDLNIAQLIRIR